MKTPTKPCPLATTDLCNDICMTGERCKTIEAYKKALATRDAEEIEFLKTISYMSVGCACCEIAEERGLKRIATLKARNHNPQDGETVSHKPHELKSASSTLPPVTSEKGCGKAFKVKGEGFGAICSPWSLCPSCKARSKK